MTDAPAVRAALPVNLAGAAPSVATPGAASALAAISRGEIPAAVAHVGAVINGVVAERGPRGQIVIRTDNGAITLQTALALQIGAAVTLQMQSLGAQPQALILSVDGQPLASQARTGSASFGSVADKPAAALPIASPSSKALMLDKSVGKPAAAPSISQVSAIVLRLGAVTTGALTTSLFAPTTSHSSGPQTPKLAAGQNLSTEPISVRVLGVSPAQTRAADFASSPHMPPPEFAPGIAIAEDAVTFNATVLIDSTAEAAGTTLLRTPFGLMRLPLPAGAAPGSQLLLELLTPRAQPTAPTDHMAQELGATRRLTSIGQEWPALRDVVSALKTAAPELAQRSLTAAVPQVGPSLAAGLLFFIAAARNGNLRQWLSDPAVETLEHAGHGRLVNRLADDMANMPRLAETQANGWQTLLLPVFDGDKLRQIRMSMRRMRKDENGSPKDGARFIIEAELSKLGPLQLDGLVRLPNFDLAVRTQDNLPPEIRANIVELFNDAMQATRLTGTVAFQVVRDTRPGPFENWQAAGPGVVA